MFPFLLSYDRLTFTLAPFLCFLFGRNIFWLLGRRDHRFLQGDNLTEQQRFCALFASLFALIFLFFYHSYLGIFSLGMMLFFCSLQARFSYFRIEIFPFLMLYALYPSFWTEIILIGCLLCPLLKYIQKSREEDIYFLILIVTLRLSEGLFSDNHLHTGGSFFFFLLLLMMVGSIFSFIFGKMEGDREGAVFYCIDNLLLWRPLFLISFIEIASENNLTDTVQVAYTALFIEIFLRFYRLISYSSLFLQSLIPILPGFIILWLSLHCLVGVATVSSSWMILSLFILCLFVALSVLETVSVIGLSYKYSLLSYYSKLPIYLWAGVLITPLLANFVSLFLTNSLPAWNDWEGWAEILYLLKGGDGASLALPILWVLFLLFYWGVKKYPYKHQEQDYANYYSFFTPWLFLIERGNSIFIMRRQEMLFPRRPFLHYFENLWQGLREQFLDYRKMFLLETHERFSSNLALISWLVFLAIMLILVGLEQ